MAVHLGDRSGTTAGEAGISAMSAPLLARPGDRPGAHEVRVGEGVCRAGGCGPLAVMRSSSTGHATRLAAGPDSAAFVGDVLGQGCLGDAAGMTEPRYTDPTSGDQYVVCADGQTRWVDDPAPASSPSRPSQVLMRVDPRTDRRYTVATDGTCGWLDEPSRVQAPPSRGVEEERRWFLWEH